MRRFVIVLPVVLTLSGCAALAENALSLSTGLLTKSIQNPVTKSDLYRIENGLTVVISAASTYKALCEARKVADSCVGIVARLQSYSRTSRPLIRSLRTFVRKNDQVNAKAIFETLKGVISEFRSEAQSAGIAVGEVQ